jgi:hypothetical protein
MKQFFSKLFTIIAIFFAITSFSVIVPTSQSAYADPPTGSSSDCSSRTILGLKPWDCNIKSWENEDNLKMNIWIIATNVANDITVIAAYLVLGYVIYGGYLYMFASGDSSKAANGKKTLTRAFIGLAIVMSATIIVNTIHIALLGSSGAFTGDCVRTQCVKPEVLVTNLIQWVIGTAGIVAAIFVVVGGVTYITASGDPTKVQKAKTTIIYALIGLAIVGLAEVITAFVSGMIREADKNGRIETTIIAKEINEK